MKIVDYDESKISELLDKTNWANDISWSNLEIISMYFKAYKVRRGEVLLEEGEIGNFMGLIIEGHIEVYKDSSHGVTHLAKLGPSQTFGEISMIDGEKCSASARADTDAIILLTNKERLSSLAETHPSLGFDVLWKISKLLSRRLRKTSGELVDFL